MSAFDKHPSEQFFGEYSSKDLDEKNNKERELNELIATIRCLHKIYYVGDFLKDPAVFIELHKHMEVLFNFAKIESSTVDNNPDEMTCGEFLGKFE